MPSDTYLNIEYIGPEGSQMLSDTYLNIEYSGHFFIWCELFGTHEGVLVAQVRTKDDS